MAAEDGDGDPLTYGISGSYAYFFKVTPATGEVKLASSLDYEVKGSGLEGVRGQGAGARGWVPWLCSLPKPGLTLVPFSPPAADTLLVPS